MRLRQITASFILIGFTSGIAVAAPFAGPPFDDPRTDRMAFGRSHSTTVVSDPDLGVWSIVTYPSVFQSPFALRNPWSTDERMSLGLSYWAALALIGGRPVTTTQSIGATAGLRPKTHGSLIYANLVVPLIKGVASTHVSAFGRF